MTIKRLIYKAKRANPTIVREAEAESNFMDSITARKKSLMAIMMDAIEKIPDDKIRYVASSNGFYIRPEDGNMYVYSEEAEEDLLIGSLNKKILSSFVKTVEEYCCVNIGYIDYDLIRGDIVINIHPDISPSEDRLILMSSVGIRYYFG